ncbi:endonuclease/exonuclease/phosphatase family protein [Nocardioides sp. C4-1]|uniref:endonuclease/exonuclease/phosphatase family protein n=1 Tax=Nocardioides sp. C4-1 TaxID=3151851 RepID=UPI0032649D3A
MSEPGQDDEQPSAPTRATAPSHRVAAMPRDSIITVVLVSVLALAGVSVAAWAGISRTTDDPAPAAASGSTKAPSTPQTTITPSIPPPPPPTQTAVQVPELTLPTLKQVDRKLKKRGFERIAADRVQTLSFVVSSFNVLGASHTRGPGRRPGFAGAEERLPGQLAELERKQVSIAGLQEFQYPQVAQLASLTGDTWGIFPGTSLGERLADNSIIWRNDTWELVESQTIDIPYFGGAPMPMPYVLLEHRETGRRVWVGNFHNPANIGGDHAGWRQRALELEADLAQRLHADGTPVIITGDMNDREAFACPFAARSGMVSAEGAYDDNGQCMLPAQLNVDWIWGTTDMQFGSFLTDYGVQDRKLTDHPMITATSTLAGADQQEGCQTRITRSGPYWYCKV